MSQPSHVDVLIIGASVAGSATALDLARAGLNVLVVDKDNFPRRKACGEGVSSLGVRQLRRLGVEPGSSALPAHPLTGYVLWRADDNVRVGFADVNSNAESGFGCQRYLLDAALIKQARDCGVHFLFGQQVRQVATAGRNEHVVSLNAGNITAKTLVLADGSNSIIAENLGINSTVRRDSRFAYSMTYEGAYLKPVHEVQIFLHAGLEICCTPVSDSRLNIAVLARKSALATAIAPQQLAALIKETFNRIGFSGELCTGPLAPLGIGPLNRTARGGYHRGIFLVGDCCETLDPIGGMGITHALLSSSLAAQAIVKILKLGESPDSSGVAYERARRMAMRPLRGFTRLTYFYLKSLGSTPLFTSFGRTSLLQHVSVAAHRNAPSSLGLLCCNLLLYLSGW